MGFGADVGLVAVDERGWRFSFADEVVVARLTAFEMFAAFFAMLMRN